MVTITRTFPGTAESVAEARSFVGALFTGPARDDALLLTSEIAGNVARHVGGGYKVTVEVGEASARVTVRDTGSTATVPAPRQPSDDREGGRGLALVEAFATAWGTYLTDGGRAVWFDIAIGAHETCAA